MSKSFSDLRKKMSPEAQKLVKEKTKHMLQELTLQELRAAREMSQEKLAHILATKQANISRIERRTDMYVSTLRSYIEAMGGQLEILARFPEGTIEISQFSNI
jgi:ribosome-binding protein aMBF1 (putative translation factor)